jgi:uncharacterized protein with GYD domain
MPKYLIQAKYTAAGAKGIRKEGGTARRAAVEKAIAGLDGRLETFYFAFGDTDAFVIAELPDNAAAAALSFAVGESGAAATQTVVLLTPDEVDQGSRKTVQYRPPGG